MFLGLVKRSGIISDCIQIEAEDKDTAQNKLDYYIKNINAYDSVVYYQGELITLKTNKMETI